MAMLTEQIPLWMLDQMCLIDCHVCCPPAAASDDACNKLLHCTCSEQHLCIFQSLYSSRIYQVGTLYATPHITYCQLHSHSLAHTYTSRNAYQRSTCSQCSEMEGASQNPLSIDNPEGKRFGQKTSCSSLAKSTGTTLDSSDDAPVHAVYGMRTLADQALALSAWKKKAIRQGLQPSAGYRDTRITP